MRYVEPTKEQVEMWAKWVKERPDCIRKVIEELALEPWTLYKLKTTGQRVCVQAFQEPGDDGKVTCTVAVLGEFNFVTHERAVFGIDPRDLEACDLPGKDDLVGNLDLPFEVLKGLVDR